MSVLGQEPTFKCSVPGCLRSGLSWFGWLVGCFGFNGPLRQYCSLYRVSQREGERGEKINESKNVQTTPTRTYCKCSRPLPYCNPNCRTPRHRKFTQHHRTTRPPPYRGFNWGVSFAPDFQCWYFCESSCLFYLRFNFDSYVSKIMHL